MITYKELLSGNKQLSEGNGKIIANYTLDALSKSLGKLKKGGTLDKKAANALGKGASKDLTEIRKHLEMAIRGLEDLLVELDVEDRN